MPVTTTRRSASSSRPIHITKWAQSAIVPDPTNVLDYNRFMMVRGNPLKYNDPTGHCAANDDGSPDFAGDAKCYERAAEYYYTGPDSLRDVYPDFGKYNKSFATAVSQEGFESMLCSLWCAWHSERGVHHERYNPEPTMNPIPAGANDMPSLPNPCSFWDCIALGIDATTILVELGREGAFLSTPVTGPAGVAGGTYGQVAANAATTASIAYVSQQRMVGKATNIDVAVTGVTAGIGQIPVVGVAGGFLQLGWDLLDPFHSY